MTNDIRSRLKRTPRTSRAWDYHTEADNIGHVLYPGYFSEVADMLREGEYIFVKAADGWEALFVKSANPLVVVRLNDSDGPHDMFPRPKQPED